MLNCQQVQPVGSQDYARMSVTGGNGQLVSQQVLLNVANHKVGILVSVKLSNIGKKQFVIDSIRYHDII